MFEVQTEIAEVVLAQLGLALPTAVESKRPTESEAAYTAYLSARSALARQAGWDSYADAVTELEEAVELDPGFAAAYALLAQAHGLHYHYGDRSETRGEATWAAAREAARLDPDSPATLEALATAAYRIDRDYERASSLVDRALQARPADAELLLLRGSIRRRAGDWRGSIADYRRATSVDPRDHRATSSLSISLFFLGEYEESRALNERALAIDDGNLEAWWWKARHAYRLSGPQGALDTIRTAANHGLPAHGVTCSGAIYQFQAGLWPKLNAAAIELPAEGCVSLTGVQPRSLLRGLALSQMGQVTEGEPLLRSSIGELGSQLKERPTDFRLHASLGLAHALLGEKEPAVRHAERAVELHPVSRDAFEGPEVLFGLASTYAYLGQVDQALDTLEELAGVPNARDLADLGPFFDGIRRHPRFRRLLDEPGYLE